MSSYGNMIADSPREALVALLAADDDDWGRAVAIVDALDDYLAEDAGRGPVRVVVTQPQAVVTQAELDALCADRDAAVARAEKAERRLREMDEILGKVNDLVK
ncbi:MAG TPA: hypothetical protein VIX35_08450 [Vicinamibacterales bacterium]